MESYMDTDEIKARLYVLPTRDELEKMLSAYVTKEVFHLQFEMLRHEIKELRERPDNNRTMVAWIAGVIVSGIAIVSFLSGHISWK